MTAAYLVDTDVLSALAPTKPLPGRLAMQARFEQLTDRLFLSTVTLAEIERGIACAVRIGATTKAQRLRHWLDGVQALYGDRLLPFDLSAAQSAGPLLDRARGGGAGFADVAIAATAEAQALTVLTRNMRHFEPLGVRCIDPFEDLPKA